MGPPTCSLLLHQYVAGLVFLSKRLDVFSQQKEKKYVLQRIFQDVYHDYFDSLNLLLCHKSY